MPKQKRSGRGKKGGPMVGGEGRTRGPGAPGPKAGRGGRAQVLSPVLRELRVGLQRQVAGDLDGAVAAYEDVLRKWPDHADALHYLAMARNDQREFATAEGLLRRVLEREPRTPGVWMTLGIALQGLARNEDALDAYRRACEADPEDVDAQFRHGSMLARAERFDAAIDVLREVARRAGDKADAWEQLGIALRGARRFDEALDALRRASELAPDSPAPHSNIGSVHHDRFEFPQALKAFDEALRRAPRLAVLHVNRGAALVELDRRAEAMAAYKRAIDLDPGLEGAWRNLGKLLLKNEQFDEAVHAFRKALDLAPLTGALHRELARAEMGAKEIERAEADSRKAIELVPHDPDNHLMLASVLKIAGRFDEAEAACKAALELDPRSPMAFVFLVFMKRFDDAEQLEEHLASREWHPTAERQLRFALGSIYDRKKQPEQAWPHFLEANRLKDLHADGDERKRQTARVMEELDRETIERGRAMGGSTRRPIFVLGMPRSGTSLAEQILDAHPEVVGVGESHAFSRTVALIGKGYGARRPFPDGVHDLSAEDLASMAARYVSHVGAPAEESMRWVDKTPGNFLLVGMIHQMFPDARIIHTRREPLDTCLSNFVTDFEGDSCSFSYDLATLRDFYQAYEQVMDHWHRVCPVPILDLQYEEVVDDLEGQVRRLLEYCELEWDDRCLEFHRSRRAVFTASGAQVREKIYKRSVARWKAYEPFLGPLLDLRGGGEEVRASA